MAAALQKVGILAGGGALPLDVARGCEAAGRPYYVVRLQGYADHHVDGLPGESCSIAEVGKILKALRREDCGAVTMAGYVQRPDFSSIRPDLRGMSLLPKVLKAARRGDGALLDVLVATFEGEGFAVLGANELAGTLTVPAGALGSVSPAAEDWSDIAKAAAVVTALGPFDVGQGAVVRSGLVLGIEAAEGTDALLARCAGLPETLRGKGAGERGGVLVKAPKPGQDRRVDLPTIGVRTVEGAARAGLAGIAVEAGAALVLGGQAVAEAADERGIFVYGFGAEELGAHR